MLHIKGADRNLPTGKDLESDRACVRFSTLWLNDSEYDSVIKTQMGGKKCQNHKCNQPHPTSAQFSLIPRTLSYSFDRWQWKPFENNANVRQRDLDV